jgi:hypothetical protein
MAFTLKRLAGALVVGGATGFATALAYAVVYAIVGLYLSGHSMTPAWFEPLADILLFVVAGSAAIGTGVVVWRASRPR